MDIQETVYDLIKKNRIDTAIDTLIVFLKDKDEACSREAIALSARFAELATKKRRGLIEDEKAMLEHNLITDAVFDLADYASGKKTRPKTSEKGEEPKSGINVENAGVVGDKVNLSGEYVAGGNITINNFYNKEEKEGNEKKPDSGAPISEAELAGLQITEEILIEKLSDLRRAFAIQADGSKKFELKKSIEQAEGELTEIHKKMGK